MDKSALLWVGKSNLTEVLQFCNTSFFCVPACTAEDIVLY